MVTASEVQERETLSALVHSAEDSAGARTCASNTLSCYTGY